MNSVPPCRWPSAREPVGQLGRQLDVQRRAAVLCTAGRGRSVGSSSGSGARPAGRASGPAAGGRFAVRRRALPDGEVGVLHGQLGQLAGSPSRAARYSSARSPASTPIDQPSVTMWCSARQSTCSSSASRSSPARSSGPCRRSKPAPASAASGARQLGVALGSGQAGQVPYRQRHRGRRRDELHGRAVPVSKVVRSASCRATSASSAAPSAVASSAPRSRSAQRR